MIISLHTPVCMHNSIAVRKSEVSCTYRVGVALDAGEIIVVLSGHSMEGGKNRQRKAIVIYLHSLTLVNLT